MRFLLFLFLLSFGTYVLGQNQGVIYILPGQGSDERLFKKMQLEEHFEVRHIIYPVPIKGEI